MAKEKGIRRVIPLKVAGAYHSRLMASAAIAQDDHHDNHAYVQHKEWKKGAPIKHEDWDRGDKVDYRQSHLSAPPAGYEWRMVDGNYVLANSSNFQIRTVIRVK